jgi:hypothetical protein
MDNETAVLPDVPAEVREAARQAGGGWLYAVVGTHQGMPPPRYIKGAWRLDGNGELTGEYIANENYGRAIPVSGKCPMGFSGPRSGSSAPPSPGPAAAG